MGKYRCIVFGYKDFGDIVSEAYDTEADAITFGNSFGKGSWFEIVEIIKLVK